MIEKQDPIAHAVRLLREAAQELRQAHTYPRSEDWGRETEAKAAYNEHMAAAKALVDWEAAVGAGGVQALSAAPAEVLGWIYEDELPENYPYDAMFPHSKVDAVRMFPVFGPLAASPTPPAEQQALTTQQADEVVAILRAYQSNLGSCEEACSTGGMKMWRRIDVACGLLEASPSAEQQAAPKAAPGEPSDWKPLKTSKEGRDAVRSFFREKLKRHDFDEYIMGTLAADFACVLGGYLRAAPQKEAQEPANLPDVEDMAHSAVQEALSYGVNHDLIHRWMRAVMDKTVAALTKPAPAPLSDDVVKDAARWRWLSEHIGVAWDEGKFTSLVRIVSDKNRAALNASIDHMMAGDWIDAALAAQGGK